MHLIKGLKSLHNENDKTSVNEIEEDTQIKVPSISMDRKSQKSFKYAYHAKQPRDSGQFLPNTEDIHGVVVNSCTLSTWEDTPGGSRVPLDYMVCSRLVKTRQ